MDIMNTDFLSGTNYHIWKSKTKDLTFAENLPVFATEKPESK